MAEEDVDLVLSQSVQHPGLLPLAETDVELGVHHQQALAQFRGPHGAVGVAQADAQALPAGILIAEFLLELLLGQEQLLHLLEIELAVFRRAHGIAAAVKELGAQLPLQLGDEGGESGLRDVEPLRGPRDVLLLRQHQQIVELIQSHKMPPPHSLISISVKIGNCKFIFINDLIGFFQFYKREDKGLN